MATSDLVQLIDLSLGSQPCGVVNFNYLHGLLHEIVKRLVQLEDLPLATGGDGTGGVFVTGGGKPAVPVPGGGGAGGGTSTAAATGGATGEETDAAAGEKEPEGTTGAPPSEERKPTSAVRPSTSSSTSGASLTRPYTSQQGLRGRPSIVTAANDLGALERKLQELELRMNTMDTLPEMLEKKSSDINATPVQDMWNFTKLDRRLGGVEEGLGKTSSLVDELLGEVQGLKSQVSDLDGSLGEMGEKLSVTASQSDLSSLQQKVKNLEALKLAAAQGSMDSAGAAMLAELQGKLDALQEESQNMKQTVDALDPSAYVTSSELEGALGKHEEEQKRQSEALAASERSLQANVSALDEKVASMIQEMSKFTDKVTEMESALTQKVNISDLTSLMPQGGGDASSLMPKLLEIQNKLAQLEEQVGKQPGLPSDLLDQIASMQKAIDTLSAELASLSSLASTSGEDRSKLDDLGSQLAQLRERMAELDRAITALSNAVSSARLQSGSPDEEEGAKYAGVESLEALQGGIGQIQQEHERLMGTVAHLSHELGISKEHIKSLYSAADDLRATKADKELVEVEVGGKADRTALEGKASRDWVDSTFEKLDREIREATAKLLGQEEALKLAIDQLNEDVEGKLDRMELQPLKEYFDKKLDRVKTAPTVVKGEASADDAAGFKKPLRFRCISCDKPVGIKPLGPISSIAYVSTFPGTRSFRPYTTYELEAIRKHQRLGYPILGSMTDFNRSLRSAGGNHTVTRPHQRIRVAPLGTTVYTPEPSTTYPSSRISPSVNEEVQVIGQDGHIYKGRSRTSSHKLPPIGQPPKHGGDFRRRMLRPSTSPLSS